MICGYAAVFNRDSSDMGFIEQVDPRAFDKTVKEADVRALGNHDADWLLGRTKSGTLRLSTDTVGLWYEVDVNESDPDGQRAIEKIRRRDLDGSSFSFVAIRDEWDWQSNPPRRRLLECGLVDVGPVVFPAYPDATAAARSALGTVAKKTGFDVDELVSALGAGEIRSLLDPSVLTAGPVPGTDSDSEDRAGAMLSKSSKDSISQAVDVLKSLLEKASESVDDGDGSDDETLLDQALEMGSVRAVVQILDKGDGDVSASNVRALLELRERELRVMLDNA